jgi:hypothetical protein
VAGEQAVQDQSPAFTTPHFVSDNCYFIARTHSCKYNLPHTKANKQLDFFSAVSASPGRNLACGGGEGSGRAGRADRVRRSICPCPATRPDSDTVRRVRAAYIRCVRQSGAPASACVCVLGRARDSEARPHRQYRTIRESRVNRCTPRPLPQVGRERKSKGASKFTMSWRKRNGQL